MLSLKDRADMKENGSMEKKEVAKIIATDEHSRISRTKNSTKNMLEVNERFKDTVDLFMETNDKLMKETDLLSKKSKLACSAVKSVVNEVRDQLLKVDSILGDNVEHKITQLERVAVALKTIKELSDDNATMAIVGSITKR